MKYTLLGVEVTVEEHKFPDHNEVSYVAFFNAGGKFHQVKWETLAGLKKKVSLIIHSTKYNESINNE